MNNQYLIGIYKGHACEISLNKQFIPNHLSNINFSKQEIQVENNLTYTLILEETKNNLTAGMTDQYYSLTKHIQTLPIARHFYFVYDYKSRKHIKELNQICSPLIVIETTIEKLEHIVQTMKNIKYSAFAGFNINLNSISNTVTVAVCISSNLLERVHTDPDFSYEQTTSNDEHFLYLKKVHSLISTEELADKIVFKTPLFNKDKETKCH
ncbi:hypothetical protein QUF99_15660 [Bacillus sp. DX4.1]|uniref:hypothetical protein n=1 Tax=Bacillus sp. DX4.1 TaxID=3055867 RepID=UPI0025A27A5F|nr:hypothetical protein [Bacillus sp. DX4.1]MDM5188701.1 hypothetical protein [Bacillus sp. DX4.1]